MSGPLPLDAVKLRQIETPQGRTIQADHNTLIVTDGRWIQIKQRTTVRIIRAEGVLMTLYPAA